MKYAKFYCENCRKEVRSDVKVCPHCGRFFSAVRCPSCGFTGESRAFLTGCPSCGYAGGTGSATRGSPGEVERYDFEAIARGGPYGLPPRRSGSTVPSWVFALAGGVLFLCFLALVAIYLGINR